MMKKRLMTLGEPHIVWLEAEATRLGISVSDVVRRLIDAERDKQMSESRVRVRQALETKVK